MTHGDSRSGPAGPSEKAEAVRGMFSAIAPSYDLLNHLLSLNRDRAWRRHAVDRLLAGRNPDGLYIDACAGTMDLARELAGRRGFRGHVVACDFAIRMLERGARKIRNLPVSRLCADTLSLPFASGSVDGATIGFGVRNLADLDRGLEEMARVLKPGAPLVVLEFAVPRWQPFRALFLFYFRRVLPFIGRLVSRHATAYTYLPASVLAFPGPHELSLRFEALGFEAVHWRSLTGGMVAVHVAERGRERAIIPRPRPAGHPAS